MPASAEEREAKLGGAVLALSGGCSAGAVPGPACPRCESEDTKFCYYNNYNVKQPRYFCKSCQRYWTAGGTLRNVQPGAGKRKASGRTGSGSRDGSSEKTTEGLLERRGGSDGSGTELVRFLLSCAPAPASLSAQAAGEPVEDSKGQEQQTEQEAPRATRRRSVRARRAVEPLVLSLRAGERKAGLGGKSGTNHPAAAPAAHPPPAQPQPPPTGLPLFPPQLAAWYPFLAACAQQAAVNGMAGAAGGAAGAGGPAAPLQLLAPEPDALLAAASTHSALSDAAAAAAASAAVAAAQGGWPQASAFPPIWSPVDPAALMYMHYAYAAQAAAAAAAAQPPPQQQQPQLAPAQPDVGFHPFIAEAGAAGVSGGLFQNAIPGMLLANPSAFARSLALRRQAALQAGAEGGVPKPVARRTGETVVVP